MAEFQVIFCTCPDMATAETIARQLVDRRLAACVNMLPDVRSVYRWQGQTEDSAEVLLLIKAPTRAYSQLESTVRALHPYELPEIVAVSIDAGLPAYLAWMDDAVEKNNE